MRLLIVITVDETESEQLQKEIIEKYKTAEIASVCAAIDEEYKKRLKDEIKR